MAINQLQVATQGFIGKIPTGIYSQGFIGAAVIVSNVGGSSTKSKSKKRRIIKVELPIEQEVQELVIEQLEVVEPKTYIKYEPVQLPTIKAVEPNFDFVPYVIDDNIDIAEKLLEAKRKRNSKIMTMLLLSV